MRIVLGILALSWLAERPWAQALVVGAILVGVAVVVWGISQVYLNAEPAPVLRMRTEPRFDRWHAPEEPPPSQAGLLSRIKELEGELRTARSEVQALAGRTVELQRELDTARNAAHRDRPNPLPRRVGLDQDAPDWVVVAVRRAYRRRLHPDGHPSERKAEAERRFKQAEAVFAEIWRVRGFQP